MASPESLVALGFGRRGDGMDPEHRELVAAVRDARREYVQAEACFHDAVEPELVDHAVLRLAAAERRYTYLLAQARRAGLRLPWAPPQS